MMQEWVVGQVRDAEARGDARREAVRGSRSARAYVESVRARVRESFGPLPEKTPLNARTTRKVERDAYDIETVVFESRPGYPVTANLYVPRGRGFPLPGVVGTCGHSANGKAMESYQGFAQGLARLGYVVLIFDPPGQGERFQYLAQPPSDGTPAALKSRYGPGVTEHIRAGNQMGLVGEFLGTWFAWDGIRALDYLLTRPEVDPKRIGVTGNSGGGTQTTWLCGLEHRWTMAAPACFVTTFRRNAENELPADTEQCPPNALALDLDHSDFLAALAPAPVTILAKEKDYFDVRGATLAHERLSRLYDHLDRRGDAHLVVGPTYHGYTQENREAMYRFFNSVVGYPAPAGEPALTIEKDETLWASPRGQIGTEPGVRTIASFTREKAAALAAKRGEVSGDALLRAVREGLRLPTLPAAAPDFRILRNAGARGYPARRYCTYAVETEPGIFALVTRLDAEELTSRPPRGASRAVLYVSHRSADAELRGDAFAREMAADTNIAFFAMDVRGVGESRPDTCGKDQFLRGYGSDYFLSAHGLMLGRPYLGQKAYDVMRVVQWLAANGHTEVHLAARGWGALAAAPAAVLSPAVRQVTLKNALTSWGEVASAEDYDWPFAALPHGVLERFDLPDLFRALNPRSLRQIDPWGPLDGMKE
jgi:cephalosporin-C deacetylase-like acetyl esterase